MPASPRYATVSPTYIGLRVKRYGPHVTSCADRSPGTVVVRALRNVISPQPAMTAPLKNSAPPASPVTGEDGRTTEERRACSRPTPARYASTNTHGTGT